MHISEGILNSSTILSGWGLTFLGVGFGLKRVDLDKIPLTALLTSFFFVASLVHIPFGPTSVHLILNGLLGILLGWASFPVIFVGLLLQTIFFQFGGIIVLGVNTFNMAVGAILGFYVFKIGLRFFKNYFMSGFIASFLAVCISAFFVSLELVLNGDKFLNVSRFIFIAHIPVMVIEGIITGFLISYLRKTKPEILLILLFMFFSQNLFAHRVNVFAYQENGTVYVEGYFSDGSPCRDSDIIVYNEKGKEILKGKTNKNGNFSFPYNRNGTIKIVLSSPGHRNEFILKGKASVNKDEIEKEKQKAKVKLKDILAGLGYIFGIAGILMYLRYRRTNNAS